MSLSGSTTKSDFGPGFRLTMSFNSLQSAPLARLDRVISLYLSHPFGGVASGRARQVLPILMYHSVSEDLEERVHPYYRLATSPRRFAEQMQWLFDLGYRGLALEEALPTLLNGSANGRPPVAITFDDGFRNFHVAAWPILQRHGFTATMYLPTGFVSQKRKSFLGKECLTWDEVRELRRHGIRFGSHTVNHPELYKLSWSEIESETTISKERVQQELQEEVTSFAYPYAFPQEDRSFTYRFVEMLRKTGYRHCATTVIGRARRDDDPFYLKRLPANSCDDRALFAAKLEGAYDWLGSVQSLFRIFKRRRSPYRA
jgi:peptidoglycan/xylan/chitin deacetylase (PgdA/CDA1 family)